MFQIAKVQFAVLQSVDSQNWNQWELCFELNFWESVKKTVKKKVIFLASYIRHKNWSALLCMLPNIGDKDP